MSVLPNSIDWRSWATPIKNQKSCGACTAFGVIGVWETKHRIMKDDPSFPIDISEKDLFFCSAGTCSQGNSVINTLNKALRGVATEVCAPYTDKDVSCGSGRCSSWWNTGFKLASFTNIQGGGNQWAVQNNIKKSLQNGPIAATMSVHESFKHYISGVYHNLGLQDPIAGAHMIGIFGYNDDKQAILMRNSWGTDWGEAGYAWISYEECFADDGSFIFGTCYDVMPSDAKPEPDPTPPAKVSFWQAIINAIKKFFNWV